MIELNVKLAIGFITYGEATAKYLPYFLESIKEQTFKDFQILAVDNTEIKDNENEQYIKANFPKIKFRWAGENLGFAKAYNIMIKEAMEMGAEYFLCINPDIILEPNAIGKLIEEIEKNRTLGSVSPKILKWDFKNNKRTNIIDTCGIKILTGLIFADVGQGEIDRRQFDNVNILGPSGAAALCRINALSNVSLNNEYFDELMFMYKEDCDLALRLRLAGWETKLVPEAIVYHDRTVAITDRGIKDILKSRFRKSRQVKKWSYLNQWIIVLKYIKLFSWRIKAATWWYQIKSLVFILLFEQYLLKELWKLWKIREAIKKKRKELRVRVDIKEIERFIK